MLSLQTAVALQKAGLIWQPTLHDFFAIPNVDMDERMFILTDMMAELTILKGWPAITFNGAVEWSLDYILQMEAVWLPREEQLRTAVAERTPFQLRVTPQGYACVIPVAGTERIFAAAEAEEAYAGALLFLLGGE